MKKNELVLRKFEAPLVTSRDLEPEATKDIAEAMRRTKFVKNIVISQQPASSRRGSIRLNAGGSYLRQAAPARRDTDSRNVKMQGGLVVL